MKRRKDEYDAESIGLAVLLMDAIKKDDKERIEAVSVRLTKKFAPLLLAAGLTSVQCAEIAVRSYRRMLREHQ